MQKLQKIKTLFFQRSNLVLFPKRNKLEQVLKQHFFLRKLCLFDTRLKNNVAIKSGFVQQ